MINSEIEPISCSRAFGEPSGHSSASFIIGIVLFLDTFHCKTTSFSKPYNSFGQEWKYYLALFLALFWAAVIPFTRYILGAHSLDQIIFGITLGIWGGLTCHFVIRDHIIDHIENALISQHLNDDQMKQKY